MPASGVLAVMGLVQMPLALVLVWVLLGETVPGATFAGGGLIVAALPLHVLLGRRRSGPYPKV